jgi:alkanesulfonate monooxygenase SsuD/methylene tetrahydromethanopterin reductase-like flavin-dependent oxidoreductase (luciferase family)
MSTVDVHAVVTGYWDRMVVGKPDEVVERLVDSKARAEADELVLVSPGLDRSRRITRNEAQPHDIGVLRTGLAVWMMSTVPMRSTKSLHSIDTPNRSGLRFNHVKQSS